MPIRRFDLVFVPGVLAVLAVAANRSVGVDLMTQQEGLGEGT